MTKSILLAAFAIAGMTFCSDNAFAGRRCCRNQQPACGCATTCCATNCCNTGCDNGCSATPNPQPATSTSPTTGSNGYQSYSYEPGAGGASPVYAAPTATVRRSTSSMDQFRGDRKARGIFN